jgi:signal transduction histidine kinase
MVFSVTFNMISYFMLAIVLKDYRYQLQDSNMALYLFNQLVGILFIFYGLFLIKSENTGYQTSILSKNEEIARNAELLQEQTRSLTEANAVKNKLFSVIAHDLKIPMYALRNLFINIREQNLPAKEIKAMLPDVIINLNHTTGLMENLLQWAKSQMNAENIHPEELDIAGLIRDVERLLHLQAASKEISLVCPTADCVMVIADKDSIHLVLRNLITNAIKFTPNGGIITISLREVAGSVEVSVEDSGVGMSKENLERINRNDTFTTNGTAHEPGTGLGLMLCKDFLVKNKSRLFISSEKGKGSVFSFVLKAAE